jgi:hypothetical protein
MGNFMSLDDALSCLSRKIFRELTPAGITNKQLLMNNGIVMIFHVSGNLFKPAHSFFFRPPHSHFSSNCKLQLLQNPTMLEIY